MKKKMTGDKVLDAINEILGDIVEKVEVKTGFAHERPGAHQCASLHTKGRRER